MTTLKYYAAAVEKSKVREMINDWHFDFIPKPDFRIDLPGRKGKLVYQL